VITSYISDFTFFTPIIESEWAQLSARKTDL
jgi:hypothetical protein